MKKYFNYTERKIHRLLILGGGPDEERNDSIKSAQYVCDLASDFCNSKALILPNDYNEIISALKNEISDSDTIFNALHGPLGEGGQIDFILNYMNYKNIHTNQHITINKMITNIIARDILKINVAKSHLVHSQEHFDQLNLPYKVIFKPNDNGSSVRMSLTKGNFPCLVSEYIEGDDITVTIVGGKIINILKINYSGVFFSYEVKAAGKYTTKKIYSEILEKWSLSLAKIFKCEKFCRIDFLEKDGKYYFLEINTIPGMTKCSLVFQALDHENIERKELIKYLVYEYL